MLPSKRVDAMTGPFTQASCGCHGFVTPAAYRPGLFDPQPERHEAHGHDPENGAGTTGSR